jgi:hypothetical protein
LADAVEALFAEGYEVHEVTERNVARMMIQKWLAEHMSAGLVHHHATRDCCEGAGWCEARYALANTLTDMHAGLSAFVDDLPRFADESEVTDV